MTLNIFQATECAHEGQDLFSSADWLRTLSEIYGYDTRVASWSDGALPFVVRNDMVGRRVIVLPFSDYVSHTFAADALFDRLEDLQAAYPEYRIQARLAGDIPVTAPTHGWSVGRNSAYHEIILADTEAMRGSMAQNFRWGVSRAERDGLKVTFATDDDAPERFYSLYAQHRRQKFGLLSHPRRYFKTLAARFVAARRGWFAEAELDGTLVASLFLLAHGDRIYYKFGASALDAGTQSQPYNLLLWRTMERFAASHRYLDLGMSWLYDANGAKSGLIKFKESTGASARPIVILNRSPASYDVVGEDETRDTLRGVTALMVKQKLPDDDLDAAGELLFRYFT